MISFENVCYRINKKTIFKNINVVIEKGERVAIIGANGSGKSTMVKLMAGLLVPSEGRINIDSISTSDRRFRRVMGKKVGIVFQNPEHQMISINVERDLALGLENFGLATDMIQRKVAEQIDKFNLGHLRKLAPSRLSGGEKQSLALASTMILEPEILIMDEPTSHLDKLGKEIFSNQLTKLMKDDNITIINVTLDLNDVLEYDRVLVLSDGTIVEDCKPMELTRSDKKLDEYRIEFPLMIRMENLNIQVLKEKLKSRNRNPLNEDDELDSVRILACRDISFGWGIGSVNNLISGLNLDLSAGRVYGLLGKSGCGKTTLAMILAGLLKPDEGEISLSGKTTSRQDLIRQVAYIFQSPERAMFASNLYDDIAYGPRNFGFNGDRVKSRVKSAFENVGLDFESYKDRSPFTLSGGEARLAAIAGGLASDKKIVILDEPNEELDYSGRQRIGNLIKTLAAESRSVMVISHDSDFLFDVCNYLYLWSDNSFNEYEKISLYNNTSAFDEAGVKVPFVINYAREKSLIDQFRALKIDSVYHPELCLDMG